MDNSRIPRYFGRFGGGFSDRRRRFYFLSDTTIKGADMSPQPRRVSGPGFQRLRIAGNVGTPEGSWFSYVEIQEQICSVLNFLTTFNETGLSMESNVKKNLDFIVYSPSRDKLAEFGTKYFEELLGRFTASRMDVRRLIQDTFDDVLDQFGHDGELIEANRENYLDLAGEVFGLMMV